MGAGEALSSAYGFLHCFTKQCWRRESVSNTWISRPSTQAPGFVAFSHCMQAGIIPQMQLRSWSPTTEWQNRVQECGQETLGLQMWLLSSVTFFNSQLDLFLWLLLSAHWLRALAVARQKGNISAYNSWIGLSFTKLISHENAPPCHPGRIDFNDERHSLSSLVKRVGGLLGRLQLVLESIPCSLRPCSELSFNPLLSCSQELPELNCCTNTKPVHLLYNSFYQRSFSTELLVTPSSSSSPPPTLLLAPLAIRIGCSRWP